MNDRNDILAVIPTYNNEKTVARVIADVRRYCAHVLVVNDGSTDSTAQILAAEGVGTISYAPNRGKGYAIRRALRYAEEHGYRYMITIDSDGQHFASDIPKFVEEIEKTPDALLVGARNLRSDNMPGKNTFANKFSNFWFRVETGMRLDDTQSGFRLYPVRRMEGMRFLTRRYEFEVEVLVRAAWRGIAVRNIPVNVFYPEKDERVTHFRPGKDFTRISILNTFLVLGALLLSVAVPALAHQREYPAFRGGQHHPFAGFESAAGRFDRAGDLLRHRPAVGLPNDRGGGYGPLHTAQQGRGDTQLEHQHPADDPLHPLRQLLDRRAGTAARNAAVAVGHHARKGRRRHVPVRRGQFRHGRRMRGRGRGGQLRPARLL